MKKTTLIVFVILLLLNNAFAQNKSFNSNKTLFERSEVTLDKENDDIKGTISERFFTTAIIIGETILLLLIVGYWRKTRSDYQKDSTNTFKKNIKALRLERVRRFDDNKLTMKRKILSSKIEKTRIDGKYITQKAKKMEVAKGEIFLATRIKQLSSQAI